MKTNSGKTALVTGGTRGIGRAIALNLAMSGAKVIALYARDRKSAEALEQEAKAKELDIVTIRGDLTDAETFQQSMAKVKELTQEIHVLVHAAASGVHKRALELSDKHMRWTFDINFFAIHQLVQEMHPLLKRGSRLIGITSPGGVRTIPHYAAIGASKGALESLFRHYAVAFAKDGISVNLVCPGMVMTDAAKAFPDLQKRLDKTIEDTPSGELTTPEQVAGLVQFLTSDYAKNIIGQTIVMDGGKTLPA